MVKFPAKQTVFLLSIILILIISACSRREEVTPIPQATTFASSDVAAIVKEEVSLQLTAQAMSQDLEPPEPENEIDAEAIVETVIARIEEKEEQQEEVIPVTFSNEVLQQAAQSLESSIVNIYDRANPAVVFILVPPIGSGTGFVIDSNGNIVTNNHVIENGRTYEVVFSDGERRRAELIGQDVDSDLAVIRVAELPVGIEPLELGSSEDLVVGQLVATIGNPFGEQGSMSLGIISGLGRALESQRALAAGNSYSLPEVIQTDAPINPGNSGGPLLNLNAQVVGINSAIASTTRSFSGVGFSIPVDAVKRIVPSLIEKGAYDYPFMGAGFDDAVSLDEQEFFGLTQTMGAYVLNVTEGGPADKAGLVAANPNSGRGGDLIVAIDGQLMEDFADLNSYLVFHTSVGQTIEITVLRAGQEINVDLTLGSRP